MSKSNPYAPPEKLPPPEPVLPEGRFMRLGATEIAISLLQEWWEGVPRETRPRAAEALAEMTDAEATDWLKGCDVPTGTVDELVGWAEAQVDPVFSAAMAAAAENRASKPRSTLLGRLAEVSA